MFKSKSDFKQKAKNNRKNRKSKKKKLLDSEKDKKQKKSEEGQKKKEKLLEIFQYYTNTITEPEDKDYEKRKLLGKATKEDKEKMEVENLCEEIHPAFLSPKEILELRQTYNDLSIGDYVLVFPNPDTLENKPITYHDAMDIYENYIKINTDDEFMTSEEMEKQDIAFRKAFLSLGNFLTDDKIYELRNKKKKKSEKDKGSKKKTGLEKKPAEEQKPALLDRKSSKENLIPKNFFLPFSDLFKIDNNKKKEAEEMKQKLESAELENEHKDPRDLSYYYDIDVTDEDKFYLVRKNFARGGFLTEEPVADSTDVDWICKNHPPKDFLTLIRNVLLAKLVRNAHMHVRSFLSSDGKFILVVIKANEEMIKREAEKSFMDKQVELGACDLFSLEPVDNKGRPLRIKPYIRKPQFPKDMEEMPDIEKEDKESGASVSSRAQSLFQKLMKMSDLQLQRLIVNKQQQVDEILSKVARMQRMELKNKQDLIDDDNSISREVWETYYLYLAYIQELLTKVEKEVNEKKKDTKNEDKEKDKEKEKETEKPGPGNIDEKKKKKKKPKEDLKRKDKKDDYNLPEMKENEFFLYKLVFLKALGDSNEVSYAFYRNWCLDILGLESEEKKHRLKTIWQLLGTDPIPPYMKYTQAGGDIWRTYERNERGQRSKFLHMERLKMMNKILAKHVNLLKLVKLKIVDCLYPLHDLYQMDGKFNTPLFKKLYEQKILLEHQDSAGERRIKQYFVMMADEAEKTDFDTDGSSLSDDIAFNLSRPWQINVESLRNYFGEKIAMYFNFLSFYTLFLLPMAFLGIIAQAVQDRAALMVSNGMKMAFSVLIIIWSTIFIELWKRKESLFAVQFGQLDTEQAEAERPSFVGKNIRSINTDDINVLFFNPSRKVLRVLISYIISLLILGCVVTCVILILYFKRYLNECGCVDMSNTFIAAIPSIINAVQIQIFNAIYQNVALALNEYENHKLLSQYENSLVFKIFAFTFVNTFNSLVIISFMSSLFPDLGICLNSSTGVDDCFDAVAVQMKTLFITAFCKNFLEISMPYIMLSLKERTKKRNEKPLEHPFFTIDKVIEEQMDKSPYAANLEVDGTLEDYMELVIQFGFLCLFAVNFPISYLMAFFTNIAEIQVDKMKIVRFKRRPTPENAKNLGTWFLILDFLSFLSIFFNAALIAYTSTCIYMQDDMTKNKVFVLFVFLFLGIKYLIKLMISDVPVKTKTVESRHNFIKDRVERGFSGHNRNRIRQSNVPLEIQGLVNDTKLKFEDYIFDEENKKKTMKTMKESNHHVIDLEKSGKKNGGVIEMVEIKK